MSSEEALSKPGASLTLFPTAATTGQDGTTADKNVEIVAEYWDGGRGVTLVRPRPPIPPDVLAFRGDVRLHGPVDRDRRRERGRGAPAGGSGSGPSGGSRTVASRTSGHGDQVHDDHRAAPARGQRVRARLRLELARPPRSRACLNDFQWRRPTTLRPGRHRFAPSPDGGSDARAVPGFRRPAAGRPDRLSCSTSRRYPVDERARRCGGSTGTARAGSPSPWDETANLARRASSALWPGGGAPRPALVFEAEGNAVAWPTPATPALRRGRPGRVAKDGRASSPPWRPPPARRDHARRPRWTATYDRARHAAAFPRFGTPRAWLAGPLGPTATPASEVRGIRSTRRGPRRSRRSRRAAGSSDGRRASRSSSGSPVLAGEQSRSGSSTARGRRSTTRCSSRSWSPRPSPTPSARGRPPDRRVPSLGPWRGPAAPVLLRPGRPALRVERSRGRSSSATGCWAGSRPPAGTTSERAVSVGRRRSGNVPAGAIGQILVRRPARARPTREPPRAGRRRAAGRGASRGPDGPPPAARRCPSRTSRPWPARRRRRWPSPGPSPPRTPPAGRAGVGEGHRDAAQRRRPAIALVRAAAPDRGVPGPQGPGRGGRPDPGRRARLPADRGRGRGGPRRPGRRPGRWWRRRRRRSARSSTH